MNLTVLDEPDLEFHAGARHPDPRHGVADYGPADAEALAPRTVRLAVVGTPSTVEGVRRWLARCEQPIAAKNSRLGRLFVEFPGFAAETAYRSRLSVDVRHERHLRERDLKALTHLEPHDAVRPAADLYLSEIAALDEEPNVDVILIARPDDLPERPLVEADPDRPWKKPRRAPAENFRAVLKADAMRYRQPLQLIRRGTWDPKFKDPHADKERSKQDEATRAWNLFTGLYYKAGGVPWRLPRDANDLTACYVGVTFYKTTDDKTLQTSVAQVFNQRGDGVIVRGGPEVSHEDRQPHLTAEDADVLLTDALSRYRNEHRTLPARLVLHKTSSFTRAEITGFQKAANAVGLDALELIWIPASDPARLFRSGYHPPLRGTLLSLTDDRHMLYTKGSVPFYGTYPGMYIPQPLAFRPAVTESSPAALAAELLALTKMNWNQTQMDGRLPITVHTADHVGEILRHVPDDVRPQGRYAFYM